jgi:hypothetical protein
LNEEYRKKIKPKITSKNKEGTSGKRLLASSNKLTLTDPSIWSDPTKKFLDPANGIGNYPALVFHRLMKGLSSAIPLVTDRKKHILENMLYMCELNKHNVEVARKLFDSKGEFKLNLYQGSYLDLDPKKIWNVESFDAIIGNPPWNDDSGNKGAGHVLWDTFVLRSLNFLKINGYLVFIHPAGWRQPGNKLLNIMKNKQIQYLSLHNEQSGFKTFKCNTRYDWYVLQNTPSKKSTSVRFDDGITSALMITPTLPFIVNHGGDILSRMQNKSKYGFLNATLSHEGDPRRDFIKSTKTTTHIYPIVKSSTKTKGIILCWSEKPLKQQYIPKVIFSDGRCVEPFYDSGKIGTTQHGIYIQVSSEIEGRKIQRFLKSKLVSYIVAATKWSNFQTFPEIFHSIPNPKDLPDNFTDAQVYAYFGLTPEEIGHIEANQRGSGLSEYVALEAPVVSVPPPPAPVVEPIAQPVAVATNTQPDYKKMKVADLKQLCKDRKIKGITGKSKEELIAMLSI